MSIAAIVTVWSAGKGVLALMRGLNAMNGVVEDRNYVLQRIIASFYLIIFLITIIFLLIVMVFGNLFADTIVRHVPQMEDLFALLLHFRGLFSWCMMTLIFAVMYTYIPNCKLKFSHQIPGAVFSATTWNIFSWGIFHVYPAVQRVRYVWEPDDYRYCNALALFLFLSVPDRCAY